MFCKHNWVVLDKTTTKSGAEVAKSVGAKFSGGTPAMFKYKVFLVLTCTKCGKLDKTTTWSSG